MKKLTAIVLICSLLFCFAACGKSSGNNSGSGDSFNNQSNGSNNTDPIAVDNKDPNADNLNGGNAQENQSAAPQNSGVGETPSNSNKDSGADNSNGGNSQGNQSVTSQNAGGKETPSNDRNNGSNNTDPISVDNKDSDEDYVNSIISQVNQLVASQDYSGALKLLDEAKKTLLEKDAKQSVIDTIDVKIGNVKSDYAAFFVQRAKDAFANQNIDGALENIDSALELTPDNAEYTALKVEYEKYVPLALYDQKNCLSMDSNAGHEIFFIDDFAISSTEISNTNEKMTNCITWYCYPDEVASAVYYLKGNYNKVSGAVFLSETYKDTSNTGYFEAYGDGTLIYTSPMIQKNMIPQAIEFDVSDVQKLEIRFYADNFYTNYCFFNVSELTAYKNFPA